MWPYFQVGAVVQDLEGAMSELEALGVRWNPVRARADGGRLVFSAGGPPYLELIEGVPGTAWDASDGPRLDHLGFWSCDLAADRLRLAAAGLPVVVDGSARASPFTYHAARHTGMRVELVASEARPRFLARWDGTADPS